ncbi:MAG: branched-chain amino acid ABC transporter permease [Candidatus Bathyarchaeia archaeon]
MTKNTMTNILERKRFLFSLITVFLFLLFIPNLVLFNPVAIHVLCMIFLYAFMAQSWNMIGGFTGQFSLGHVTFFAIGAYTSALLYVNYNIPTSISSLIGALISCIVSIAVGLPFLRLRGHYFAIGTLTFTFATMQLFTSMTSITKGAQGVLIYPRQSNPLYLLFYDRTQYYYLIMPLTFAQLLLTVFLLRSKLGYSFLATREDPDAAESLGINTAKTKIIAFAISSIFMSIAGSIYANYVTYINPEIVFSMEFTVAIISINMVGGLGSVWGPLIGSFILVPFSEVIRFTIGSKIIGIHMVIYGFVLILVTFYAKGGIFATILRALPKIHREDFETKR